MLFTAKSVRALLNGAQYFVRMEPIPWRHDEAADPGREHRANWRSSRPAREREKFVSWRHTSSAGRLKTKPARKPKQALPPGIQHPNNRRQGGGGWGTPQKKHSVVWINQLISNASEEHNAIREHSLESRVEASRETALAGTLGLANPRNGTA